MRKRHLISIVLASLFLSVCLNSSIANTVVPFATSVACIHGTNTHTVPRQETVTGWDSNNHWIGTNNYEDCSVAGCNGTSFTGQSLINYPHIKPTKHSSESCSGGYHTFYANAPKAIAMPQSSTLESDAMGAIIHLQIASRLIALNRTGS